ncbi:hypothetical protein ABZ863_23695 [Saccharomonospora sp. NPDC046836]
MRALLGTDLVRIHLHPVGYRAVANIATAGRLWQDHHGTGRMTR